MGIIKQKQLVQTMALSLMFPEFACSSRPFAIHTPAFSRSAIRLAENDDGYSLSARVPGVAAAGVKVTVTDDAHLHIVAKSDDETVLLTRTMALPSDADPSTLSASCVDGVLEVQIHKLPVPEPAQIAVAATSPLPLEDPESAYEFRRALPGIPASEVKVAVEEGSIVSIEAKSAEYGSYSYRFTLPEHVDTAAISAHAANGVLHIRMPRQPRAEPVTVAVTSTAPMEDEADEEAHVSLATLRVPGYSANDIKLVAHEGRLALELSHKDGKSAEYWLLLPEELEDPSNLIAVCQDGILHIKYPKGALQQPVERSVEVSATRAENNLARDVDMQQ